jgi:hypothetical protein
MIISLLFLSSLVIIGMFFIVLFYGAPFLPTLTKQQKQALDLLDLQPGQLLLELGSGDGSILKLAAERGIHSIGYELNPLLFLYSKVATYKYRHMIRIKLANFWTQSLPECDGMYVFLLDKFMPRLHTKITQEITSSVKVVSFAFMFPDKTPAKEVNGLYLYAFRATKSR